MRRRRYRPQLTEREKARMVGPVQACGDCSGYTPVNKLISKNDGRKVCPGCHDNSLKLAAERNQLDMFHPQQQTSLLSLLK